MRLIAGHGNVEYDLWMLGTQCDGAGPWGTAEHMGRAADDRSVRADHHTCGPRLADPQLQCTREEGLELRRERRPPPTEHGGPFPCPIGWMYPEIPVGRIGARVHVRNDAAAQFARRIAHHCHRLGDDFSFMRSRARHGERSWIGPCLRRQIRWHVEQAITDPRRRRNQQRHCVAHDSSTGNRWHRYRGKKNHNNQSEPNPVPTHTGPYLGLRSSGCDGRYRISGWRPTLFDRAGGQAGHKRTAAVPRRR